MEFRAIKPVVVQCHASWERRLLGDAPAADLDAIAAEPSERLAVLEKLREYPTRGAATARGNHGDLP